MPKTVSHVSPVTWMLPKYKQHPAILSHINIDDVSKILGKTS